MTSKYEKKICPFCELPIGNSAAEQEYERLLEAAGDNANDPIVKAFEDSICWRGWTQAHDATIEDRLIEVLEQRDAARAENVKLRELLGKGAQSGARQRAALYERR